MNYYAIAFCLFAVIVGIISLQIGLHSIFKKKNVVICIFLILNGFFLLSFFSYIGASIAYQHPLTTDLILRQHVGMTNPILLTGLKAIEFQPKLSFFRTLIYSNENISGYYVSWQKRIIMLTTSSDTYWHELGHSIWENLLTEAERDEYTGHHDMELARWHLKLVEEENVTPLFPTMYATTNVKEDFSDSFSFYVAGTDDPIGRRLDEERRDMIDRYIKRITHCSLGNECVYNNETYITKISVI